MAATNNRIAPTTTRTTRTDLSDPPRGGTRSQHGLARASAVLAFVAGLGFGVPGVYGTWHLAAHGHVWMFLGFPTYGGGPFEDIGIDTTVALLGAFVVICAAEVLLGWMLWQRGRGAVLLALALLPFEFVFWIGFALPLGPLLGIARVLLVLAYWFARRRPAASQSTPTE